MRRLLPALVLKEFACNPSRMVLHATTMRTQTEAQRKDHLLPAVRVTHLAGITARRKAKRAALSFSDWLRAVIDRAIKEDDEVRS